MKTRHSDQLWIYVVVILVLIGGIPLFSIADRQIPQVGNGLSDEPSVPVNPEKEKEIIAEEDADFWLNKGVLFSTYGNETAAIESYKKAIALEPEKSEAYFYMGIAYGEIKEFEKAIEAVSTAIFLNPGRANYYYGRGRIYLRIGKDELAMEDFCTAAGYGDRDALDYLKSKKNPD